jgi:hypothetical protein
MKKIIVLPAFILALGLVSCKKDYKCTCTTTGGSSTGTAQVTTMVGVSKKAAKANCVSSTWTSSSGTAYTETCTLSK